MRSVIDSMTELWISKKCLIVKIVMVMVMAVVAVFQMAGISKDFVSYETYFSGLRNDGVLFALASRFEPLFVATTFGFVSFIQNDLIVYSLFVVIALWIKVHVIRQLSATWSILAVVVLFYGARFFPLFELTQIRVALATSFVFIAFLMTAKDRVKSALLFLIISIGFHFSNFVFLPFVVLHKWRFESAIALFFSCIIVVEFFKVNVLELLSGNLRVIDMYVLNEIN